jgi:DNA polymerase III delta prime subunit
MYPAQVYSGTKSYGEIEIFNRLKNDPSTSDWIVLHSMDVAEHRTQVSGEIDFVIIVPNKGVLCVEVKAASAIKRENGIWYYGKDPTGDIRGPFKQASEAMHSIRKKVISRAPSLSKIVFWSSVIFPFISFDEKSPEWHDWQLIDKTKFTGHSISYNLLAVLENVRNHLSSNIGARWFDARSIEPTTDQCKLIANILRPDFEFFESPTSRLSRRTEELKKYTEEQFEALNTMNLNPRVIFQGPAGTGKTLLATEAARRSATSGKKTLFLCFNRLLGNWLKSETVNTPNLFVGTLHSHMRAIVGSEIPEAPSADFWEKDLPLIATEKLIDNGAIAQFDQLILDEAQDLLTPSYLDFLDLSLAGGLASGNWIFFGDFEKQAIYENSETVNGQLVNRFKDIPRYSLRTNCRNSPRIAELVHLLGGLNPHYSKIRRPDNQIEPRIITFTDSASQSEQIFKLLSQLVNDEKYSLQEIVILSSRADHDAAINNLPDALKIKLSPLRLGYRTNKILYGTIHSFKGMESSIVVLTDIDNVTSADAQSLFYVGITRALDKLYILISKKVNQEMSRILIDT